MEPSSVFAAFEAAVLSPVTQQLADIAARHQHTVHQTDLTAVSFTASVPERSDVAAVWALLDQLLSALQSARSAALAQSSAAWQHFCQLFRAHHVMPLLLLDPFASRALHKPRGYAGDADMLDFVYFPLTAEQIAAQQVGRVGVWMNAFNRSRQGCSSVRSRAVVIGRWVDSVCEQHCSAAPPAVLSVASGHCREMLSSKVFQSGRLRLTALDQDPKSLAMVARDNSGLHVNCVTASIGRLLRQADSPQGVQLFGSGEQAQQFDVIFSAGLFDYLDDRLCRRLVVTLFSRLLKPGGSMLVANVMGNHDQLSWMEAALDWTLVYRTERELSAWTDGISEAQLSSKRVVAVHESSLVYLVLHKRAGLSVADEGEAGPATATAAALADIDNALRLDLRREGELPLSSRRDGMGWDGMVY